MAKKEKKKKEKKKKGSPSAPDDADAPAPKKGRGIVGQIGLMVILGAGSFGTVWFLPDRAITVPADYDEAAAEIVVQEPLDFSEDVEFLQLTPFTISLDGGNGLLKIGITLEVSEEALSSIDPDNPQLRDAFTGYLRALKPGQIRDAAYMAQMRAQLVRRARLIFGSDAIFGILITDFLVQ